MAETRSYPISCRSMFCGEIDGPTCRGCSNRPELDAFNEWKASTSATQPDPIWSPGIYRAA